ncbi:MAG: hypothetical protein V1837_03465 [Candidatus Woesearchaeota archaeon]
MKSALVGLSLLIVGYQSINPFTTPVVSAQVQNETLEDRVLMQVDRAKKLLDLGREDLAYDLFKRALSVMACSPSTFRFENVLDCLDGYDTSFHTYIAKKVCLSVDNKESLKEANEKIVRFQGERYTLTDNLKDMSNLAYVLLDIKNKDTLHFYKKLADFLGEDEHPYTLLVYSAVRNSLLTALKESVRSKGNISEGFSICKLLIDYPSNHDDWQSDFILSIAKELRLNRERFEQLPCTHSKEVLSNQLNLLKQFAYLVLNAVPTFEMLRKEDYQTEMRQVEFEVAITQFYVDFAISCVLRKPLPTSPPGKPLDFLDLG